LYFQDPSGSKEGFVPHQLPPPYKIKRGDLLNIQVSTPNFEDKQFLESSPTKSSDNGQNPYLTSYQVADSGDVVLPYVGRVVLGGKTLPEATLAIEAAVKRYVLSPTVSIKLASFSVSVLGEVRHPGRFPVFNGQINLFEALAMAGDLTENADRTNVRIVRQVEGGSFFYTVDLTQRSLLGSDKLFLQPSDVVYVEIAKPRPDQADVTKAQLAFSFVSALAFLGNILVIIFSP
jgi:polysaccharide export outer membrane protein